MWIWGRVRRVDGAVLFSPYGVTSALALAMRCAPMLDGSASDAVASTSMCPFNLELAGARLKKYVKETSFVAFYISMRQKSLVPIEKSLQKRRSDL